MTAEHAQRDEKIRGRFNIPSALQPTTHRKRNNNGRARMATALFGFNASWRSLKVYSYHP